MAAARCVQRLQAIEALGFAGVAGEFAEAGDAVDIAANAVLARELLCGGKHLSQDGAGAEQANAQRRIGQDAVEAVHAAQQVGLNDRRQRGLRVVLVHHHDVVELVALLDHHAFHAVRQDHGEFAGEGRVPGAAVGHGGGGDEAGAVLVLQALAAQGGAASSGAKQEAAAALVTGRPDQIADALKAEHRVVDVHRQHRQAVHAVRRGRGDP